jgi:hypothetical protein
MLTTHELTIESKVQQLIKNFEKCLNINARWMPFNQRKQLNFHQKTIQLRMRYGSASNAIKDDDFLYHLHETLKAWGMARYKGNLSPFPEFVKELRSKIDPIAAFDGLRIDDPQLEIQKISSELWQLMNSLEINEKKSKLVVCSKTLHHILPELVVPIDGVYTGAFFGGDYTFQYHPGDFFLFAMDNFATIAKETNPAQFAGKGWNTCRTKIIDNAIIGYMVAPHHNISLE